MCVCVCVLTDLSQEAIIVELQELCWSTISQGLLSVYTQTHTHTHTILWLQVEANKQDSRAGF